MIEGLMTIDDVKELQFFKLPKIFFRDPNYMAMKTDSKVAYTFLLDLLALSVKNKWANEHNQAFVKLSRTKLKDLLGIKGNQKVANIMKELVEFGLIDNKRVGLNRCNEIYIRNIELLGAEVEKLHVVEASFVPELQAAPLKANVPAPLTDLKVHGIDEMNEIESLLEGQVHMADLRQKYDPRLVDEVGESIIEMFFNTSTSIGQQDKPMAFMRRIIRKLEMYHIEYVIDQFKLITSKTPIHNVKKYLQTLIYNSIYEANAKMVGNISYHMAY